ncbi:histidine kinase N-terminal 7TM domain-containing protein [Paenibacillus sp. HB172176]|uniref:sensor histidine kinase n=1 Tax=Paenibacillus sp. HB172176 TaxID=2493690 RepID=UPI001438F381|nr:histidine kinase N-terminal 7TM domain-containing protein [Paenibacillus sp. HB172176]
MILSVVLTGILAVYAYMYRRERGVRYFVWVMICRIVYTVAVILELNSDGLQAKLLFRQLENSSLIMTVPVMVLCVLDFRGMERWLKPKPRSALLAAFAAWTMLVWTDGSTGWINTSANIVDGYLMVSKSAFAIALNLMAYGILALCAFFLILFLRRARPDIRKPGMWLVAFGSLAFLAEIVKTSNPDWSAWLLPISAYTGFCAMAMLLIIMRNRLFSIVPMARDIVMESMEEGILIVNERGKIVDSNPLMDRLLSLSSEGKPVGRYVSELLGEWPNWLSACLENQHGRLEIGNEEQGAVKSYLVKVYPINETKRLGTVSLLVDITDKQRSLEQIARLNGMKDQLFTVVSHDIRDPLAVQVTVVEELELQQAVMDAESRELFMALGKQIRNSYELVENVLEWFRGQREGLMLHPQSLRISELLEDVFQAMQFKSEEKGVRLQSVVSEELLARADRETTMLILRNILSNAIKFSYRGGLVKVSAETEGDRVIVTIRDFGTGMDAQQLGALFDEARFHSRIGTEGEKGAGLGLLVSLQFARLGGGRIWADSRPGEGSAFHFALPKG